MLFFPLCFSFFFRYSGPFILKITRTKVENGKTVCEEGEIFLFRFENRSVNGLFFDFFEIFLELDISTEKSGKIVNNCRKMKCRTKAPKSWYEVQQGFFVRFFRAGYSRDKKALSIRKKFRNKIEKNWSLKQTWLWTTTWFWVNCHWLKSKLTIRHTV